MVSLDLIDRILITYFRSVSLQKYMIQGAKVPKILEPKAEEICANKEAYMLLKNNTTIQGAIH